MSLRALIVDDEPPARQSIRRFLRNHPDIQVQEECGDGQSAAAAILAQKPDLVFLDIQMPELDGFQVIERVGVDRMPATVFVTAYDQYALRAFDAAAVDYLLKPVARTRFDRAVGRAREQLARQPDSGLLQLLLRKIDEAAGRQDYVDRLPIQENGRIKFVETREIRWIESAGNYARLHAVSGRYEIRDTLSSLERKLNPKLFARIHRSSIVNMKYVKEVQRWFHGYHLVLLENGQKLRMSRYQHNVAERLGLRA